MPLDEAALETLGLGTLWVRRRASIDENVGEPEPVRAAVHAQSLSAQPPSAQSPSAQPPSAQPPSAQPPSARPLAQSPSAQPPSAQAEPVSGLAPSLAPIEEPAWDELDGEPPAMPAMADRTAEPVALRGSHEISDIATLDWEALEARVSACERCRLCEKRTNTVFGVGDRAADWMLIGEAPGENEDKQGEPFVGQAGKLLDSMLRALSLARGANVYIANVVKCRPPGNRNPEPDEAARCEPYLQRQVALVKPKLIVALGRVAAQNLLKTDASISSLRGRVHRYEGVPVIVTYHPAYLLRSLPDKAKAWIDLCLADDTYRQAMADEQAR
jgi:DNA polymerase